MDPVSFQCLNGLGDKLLDVIGFYILCRRLNYRPHIEFNRDIHTFDWGNNHYDERLFDFSGLDLTPSPGTKYIDSYNPSVSLSPYKVYTYLQSRVQLPDFETFSHEYARCAKEIIRPSNTIISAIPAGIENAYGIHLRKTDKVKDNYCASHENSLNEFDIIMKNLLETVGEIIATESEPTFIIVSEEDEWKREIRDKILRMSGGKTITVLENDYSVGQSYHNFNAVIDMFSLSKCKNILQGVKYSTFSILAALLGNGKLINFSRCLPDDRDCLIYVWNSVVEINGMMILTSEPYQHFTRGSLELVIANHSESG
jgi:hypothetical protein